MQVLARTFVALAALALVFGFAGSLMAQGDGSGVWPVVQLPQEDRKEIEKYLGKGVVGRALPAPPVHTPSTFFDSEEDLTLIVKRVHGKGKGKTFEVDVAVLDRPQGRGFRLDAGDEVLFGERDEAGSFMQFTSQDLNHGVISRYDPPQPILIKGMEVGTSKKLRIDVGVFDLTRPEKKKHSGHLDLVYTYVGAYEVHVPAGDFESMLFKWDYDGKVGPAKVRDDQYWFFAPGVGPIARIHKKNVSAMLIYNDDSKSADVLVTQEYR